MQGNILIAFGLTAIAGLSTGIGSIIAFFAKKSNTRFLSVSLGFSAGVMIYVSMIEIFPAAQHTLSAVYSNRIAAGITVAAFFGGILLIGIIDRLIPQKDNPHEIKKPSALLPEGSPDPGTVSQLTPTPAVAAEINSGVKNRGQLMRTGLFTALAIAIHNFPEGLAAFVSALQEPSLAIPIVAAIAIHNIPEGIAVSVPIYYATGNKKRAFAYSFLSGLAEPLGAVVGYLILLPFMNETIYGILFAAVAGIMVFISLDELLPSAREYGEHHLSIYGLVGGMAVMAGSLLLFM